MSLRLAFGLIAALIGLLIAYRSRGGDLQGLPPPDKTCQRNGVEAVL